MTKMPLDCAPRIASDAARQLVEASRTPTSCQLEPEDLGGGLDLSEPMSALSPPGLPDSRSPPYPGQAWGHASLSN